MEESRLVALLIPIILFYLFFAFPDAFLEVSIGSLGRLISVLLIIYYTSLNQYYGLLICLFIIFYYQMDSVEGMSSFNQSEMLTSVLEIANIPKDYYLRLKENTPQLFYEKPKKLSVLVEDENKKIVDFECCPVSGKCKATVVEKLSVQEELLFPKTDENWAYKVWNQLFTMDKDNDYALGKSNKSYGLLI